MKAIKLNCIIIKRIILLSATAVILGFLWTGCSIILGYAEENIYTSPEGTNTIVVKYDHVCRPYVFKKGLFWDTKIWDSPTSGFMETVHFGVEWLSENQILLTYDDINDKYDEAYIIDIPK